MYQRFVLDSWLRVVSKCFETSEILLTSCLLSSMIPIRTLLLLKCVGAGAKNIARKSSQATGLWISSRIEDIAIDYREILFVAVKQQGLFLATPAEFLFWGAWHNLLSDAILISQPVVVECIFLMRGQHISVSHSYFSVSTCLDLLAHMNEKYADVWRQNVCFSIRIWLYGTNKQVILC
jgi:hypothetical protein